MNRWTRAGLLTWLGLAVAATAGTAIAQDADERTDDLDVTMQIIEDPATILPDAVTRRIELPGVASEQAAEAARRGLDQASEARELHQQGLDTARETREQGREFGEEMAEQAAEDREDFGRSKADELRPELPEPPVEPPVPPGP